MEDVAAGMGEGDVGETHVMGWSSVDGCPGLCAGMMVFGIVSELTVAYSCCGMRESRTESMGCMVSGVGLCTVLKE